MINNHTDTEAQRNLRVAVPLWFTDESSEMTGLDPRTTGRRQTSPRRGGRPTFPWMAAWLLLILALRVGGYLFSLKP